MSSCQFWKNQSSKLAVVFQGLFSCSARDKLSKLAHGMTVKQ